jgi:glutaredoxin
MDDVPQPPPGPEGTKPRSIKWLVWAVVGLAVLVFAYIIFAPRENHDNFAKCLSDKGVTMYGAFWCPHCAAQKEDFGDSFQYVTYVECSNPDHTQNEVCNQAGVQNYPTWMFADGSKLVGEQTLTTLGMKAGCPVQ